MKEKRTYSLTAKERKAKRMAAENKTKASDAKLAPAIDQTTRVGEEQAMVLSQKRNKSSAVIIGAIVGVAVILLLVALLVPVILLAINPYRGQNEVVARFNLDNGMTLEFVIEEDKYETAATNFIFLAQNKFFDNTVFYDAQNGWLRFGGFDAQPARNSTSDYESSHHRGDNKSYVDSFMALPNNRFNDTARKFGYRLNADKGGTEEKLLNKEGVLTYRYSDTATEFQCTYREQATNQVVSLGTGGNQSTYDINSTMIGYALNQATIDNLKAIADKAQRNTAITSGYVWYPPTPDIKISTVKVYNLDSSKWKNFDFINFVNGKDANGSNRLSQWYGAALQ